MLLKSILFLPMLALATTMANAANGLPLTKDSAASLVQQQTQGKILSVDEKHKKGKTVFQVKVLHDEGKIKIFRLDAETGQKLKSDSD